MKQLQFRDTIYSLNEDNDIINTKTGRVKKPSTTKDGYVIYALYYSGKTHSTYLHRFVKECHHGYSELEIDHIDMDKSNNNIDNLEWVESSENRYRGWNKRKTMVDGIIPPRGICVDGWQSNGKPYLKYVNNGKYLKGSIKTLEEAIEFKKEYENIHGSLDNLI